MIPLKHLHTGHGHMILGFPERFSETNRFLHETSYNYPQLIELQSKNIKDYSFEIFVFSAGMPSRHVVNILSHKLIQGTDAMRCARYTQESRLLRLFHRITR